MSYLSPGKSRHSYHRKIVELTALCASRDQARRSGKTVVRIDPVYFRPTEVDLLIGDASKARDKLGWKPKTSFAQLVKEMMASDLATARAESGGRLQLKKA